MLAQARICFRVILVFGPCLTSAIAAQTQLTHPARHCVWRVMNVAVPFYLVGSFHNLRGNDYPLAPVYRQALADSKRLVFEYDPAQRESFATKFRAAGQCKPGTDIRSEIHPATLALLLQYLSTNHIRFDDVKDLKPWALAVELWSKRGYAAAIGTHAVDDYLSYQAQRLRKEIGGLETVDEHIAFWKSMWERDGETLLLVTMVRGEQIAILFDKTRAAWKNGDIAALSATNASLHKRNRQIAQRLLDQRNRRWLPRIEAEMKTGIPTAIVAGAGHFSGANSVIDLLQKRGYRIEQL
jgi:uncharacterized protein YbaP (TraB family)